MSQPWFFDDIAVDHLALSELARAADGAAVALEGPRYSVSNLRTMKPADSRSTRPLSSGGGQGLPSSSFHVRAFSLANRTIWPRSSMT